MNSVDLLFYALSMSGNQLTHWSSLLCCFAISEPKWNLTKSVRIHEILNLNHFPFLAEKAEAIQVPQIPIKRLQYKKLKHAILEARTRQKLDKNLCSSVQHVYSIPPSVSCVYMLKSSFEVSEFCLSFLLPYFTQGSSVTSQCTQSYAWDFLGHCCYRETQGKP